MKGRRPATFLLSHVFRGARILQGMQPQKGLPAPPRVYRHLSGVLPSGFKRSSFGHTNLIVSLRVEVNPSGKIPFYDDAGKRNFIMHADNEREQDSVIDRYVEGIVEYGINGDVRGRCFVLESAPSVSGSRQGPLQCITWGTLTRAAYRAFETKGAEPEVVAAKIAGMEDVCILHARTPRDVVLWLRDYHNQWHFGSGMTYIQVAWVVWPSRPTAGTGSVMTPSGKGRFQLSSIRTVPRRL